MDRLLTTDYKVKDKGEIIKNICQVRGMVKNDRTRDNLYMTRSVPSKVEYWSTKDSTKIDKYNSIIIEFDNGESLEEQYDMIIDSGIPFSFIVWSGNKSLHTWIVLENGVSKEQLTEFSKVIQSVFLTSDKTILNHLNTFARAPFVGIDIYQPLVEYKGAVKVEELKEWLVKQKEVSGSLGGTKLLDGFLSQIEKSYIYNEKNQTWYQLVNENCKVVLPVKNTMKEFFPLYHKEKLRTSRQVKTSELREFLEIAQLHYGVEIEKSLSGFVLLEDG